MIDLHCHILPGIDDGSPDLAVSLEMARIAAADGIFTIACTPHCMPGVYNNTGPAIAAAVAALADALAEAGIPLDLATGSDAHADPGLQAGLDSGRVPTINGSRYFLLEPSHNVMPPRFEEFVFSLISGGYVPILTHPERLAWIGARYDLMPRLVDGGAMMQVTAGSLAGRFGKRPRYWAERMLDEGLIHLVASDAHDTNGRPPVLSEARAIIAGRVGEATADALVAANPLRILENVPSKDFRLPHS